VVKQHLLGLSLGEEQQEGVGGVGQAEAEHPDPDGAVAGVELDPDRVVATRDQFPRHAQPAQHLQGARLDGQRTRLVDAVELTVNDAHRRTKRPQLGGQGEPGRPGPDDQDVQLLARRNHDVRLARMATRMKNSSSGLEPPRWTEVVDARGAAPPAARPRRRASGGLLDFLKF
jgi:hypothetical protein